MLVSPVLSAPADTCRQQIREPRLQFPRVIHSRWHLRHRQDFGPSLTRTFTLVRQPCLFPAIPPRPHGTCRHSRHGYGGQDKHAPGLVNTDAAGDRSLTRSHVASAPLPPPRLTAGTHANPPRAQTVSRKRSTMAPVMTDDRPRPGPQSRIVQQRLAPSSPTCLSPGPSIAKLKDNVR